MTATYTTHRASAAKAQPTTALVVGGSLVGLATAIRLSRAGLSVTIVERGESFGADGAGLGIDRHRLSAVTGVSAIDGRDLPALPVITTGRDSAAWSGIYRWLRSLVDRDRRIHIRTGAAVTEVVAHEGRGRVAVGGEWLEADLVVGADGRGSIVRRAVAPDRPTARYAGYGLWRGVIEERALPNGALTSQTPFGVNWAEGQRLVAYEIPGPNGAVERGARAISWAWYDPALTRTFESSGALRGDEVLRSVRPEEFGKDVMSMLRLRAIALWPEPWRTAIAATIAAGRVFATPIAEYLPLRLSAGPLAIIGDAAHLASPMTGAGLITGLDDVEALGWALEGELAGGPPALATYEAERLGPGRSLALTSIRWSQGYVGRGNVEL